MSAKKEINIRIGNNIRIARERAGSTQEQLGEMIGLETKTVSAVECGAVGISISSLERICDQLSVTSDEILFGDGVKNDLMYITGRLERLNPKQLAILAKFLDGVFDMFSEIE